MNSDADSARTNSLMTSSDGIVGFWNGEAEFNGPYALKQLDEWERFKLLDKVHQDSILEQELSGMFAILGSASGDEPVSAQVISKQNHAVVTLKEPKCFSSQLPHVRTYADLRGDRIGEIEDQITDLLSFYAQIHNLYGARYRWTVLFIEAMMQVIIAVEQRVKLVFSSPRPIDLSTKVHPIISTPTHSTFPSGHSTEAFALAVLLESVRRGRALPIAEDADQEQIPLLQSFRLAARIAENRVVAGVHFPVDSAAGAVMGISLAHYLCATCHADGTGGYPVCEFDGTKFGDKDFLLGDLPEIINADCSTAIADLSPGETSTLVQNLWSAAVSEWQVK